MRRSSNSRTLSLPVWAIAVTAIALIALAILSIGLLLAVQNLSRSTPTSATPLPEITLVVTANNNVAKRMQSAATTEVQPAVTLAPDAISADGQAESAGALVQAPAVLPTEEPKPIPTIVPKPAPDAPADAPNPLFGPNYKPDDVLPVFVCATDAFASYLTLLQMQVAGSDVKHGFHLGIIPFELNDTYSLSEQESSDLLLAGKADCQLDTVDTVASASQGVITAIVDESAGGDGIWARDMESMYDLKGKRIAFIKDSSSEFSMRYVFNIAQLDSDHDVKLLPFDSIDDAVKAFNDGDADAVSAWEPQLSQASQSGGKPLLTTDQLRIIIDIIMTARKSIEERPEVVQAFHDAWFDTLKAQTENFDRAASEIAAWGANEWSAISQENAATDLRDQMKLIAQADLNDNAAVMSNLQPILNQLDVSRNVWAAVIKVPKDKLETLVDPRFILRSADRSELHTDAQPINDSFSLAASSSATAPPAQGGQPVALTVDPAADSRIRQDNAEGIPAEAATESVASPTISIAGDDVKVATDVSATLAILPCRRFTFLPDSARLTQESRRVLDLCVVPTLQQRAGLYLLVRGSAAWPGPKGTYTEEQIRAMSTARAQAIADYLAAQSIDPARLVVEGILPPEKHRETTDPIVQAEDRFVEMSLIVGGR